MKRPAAVKRVPPPELARGAVRAVDFSPRPLVMAEGGIPPTDLKGAIVWVRPSPGDNAAEVQALVERAYAEGAVRVQALPRPAEARHVAEEKAEAVPRGLGPRAACAALLEVVEEEPELVRAFVEESLTAVGL